MSELVHDGARRDAPSELLVTRDRSTLPRYESGKSQLCRGLLNWLLITGRGQLGAGAASPRRPFQRPSSVPGARAGTAGSTSRSNRQGRVHRRAVSAGCSASTTDKLHEQVSAPYGYHYREGYHFKQEVTLRPGPTAVAT
jgi:hypothetical protein